MVPPVCSSKWYHHNLALIKAPSQAVYFNSKMWASSQKPQEGQFCMQLVGRVFTNWWVMSLEKHWDLSGVKIKGEFRSSCQKQSGRLKVLYYKLFHSPKFISINFKREYACYLNAICIQVMCRITCQQWKEDPWLFLLLLPSKSIWASCFKFVTVVVVIITNNWKISSEPNNADMCSW